MTAHLTERFLNHKEVISSPNHILNTYKGPFFKCLQYHSFVLPDSGTLKEEFFFEK